MLIKQVRPEDITLKELMSPNDIYCLYRKKDDPSYIRCCLCDDVYFTLVKKERGYDITFIKIIEEEDLKKIPLEKAIDIFESEEIIENDKKPSIFDKYRTKDSQKISNAAVYATSIMSSLDGTINVKAKSNGALRIDFNDKSKAEAYLRKFKRMMHHSINPVDSVTVLEFYNMLNIVMPDDILVVASEYSWPTVASLCELTWVSKEVTKSINGMDYGFCITKRAKK